MEKFFQEKASKQDNYNTQVKDCMAEIKRTETARKSYIERLQHEFLVEQAARER